MKNRMILRVLGTVVVVMAVASVNCRADTIEQIKKAGKIKLGTEGAFAPFNYFKGSQIAGFEVDIANEIVKNLKLKPEWKAFPFDTLLIGLSQNRYDMVIASHAITEERAKAVDFAHPHYCSGAVIVSLPGGPKTKEALVGKVVSAQVGTIYVSYLQKIKGIKDVKTFQKYTDSLQALISKKIDAMVVDKFVALDMSKANPNAHLQSGEAVSNERVAMAVAKGNTSLRDALNQGLAEMLRNGSYAKLSKSYFGEDVRCH